MSLYSRYRAYTGDKYLHDVEANNSRFIHFRNKHGRRRLVILDSVAFAALAGCTAANHFGGWWPPLVFLLLVLVITAVSSILVVVTVPSGDAPASALDEYELVRRNAARLVSQTVTRALMLIPVIYLVLVGASGAANSATAYTGALAVLVVLLVGVVLPTLLLAWSEPDTCASDRSNARDAD